MADIIEILYENPTLKLSYIPSQTENAVLCFTGIGHSLGGIDVQQSEFAGTGQQLGTPVFVTDKTRSWGNRIDFVELQERLQPLIAGKTLFALGNSMGAFLAIAASTVLPIQRVFAFAPQFSVDPSIVPDEARWTKYRDTIKEFRISSLAGRFRDDCQYDIFVGDAEVEVMHWRNFPMTENIRCFIIPNTHHDVAKEMKARNHLRTIISDCINPSLTGQEIAQKYDYILRIAEG